MGSRAKAIPSQGGAGEALGVQSAAGRHHHDVTWHGTCRVDHAPKQITNIHPSPSQTTSHTAEARWCHGHDTDGG